MKPARLAPLLLAAGALAAGCASPPPPSPARTATRAPAPAPAPQRAGRAEPPPAAARGGGRGTAAGETRRATGAAASPAPAAAAAVPAPPAASAAEPAAEAAPAPVPAAPPAAPPPAVPAAAPPEPSPGEQALREGELAERAGQLPHALDAYRRAARLRQPGALARADAVRRKLVASHGAAARTALARQDLDGSIRHWERVLELDPGNETARLERQRAVVLREKVRALR